MNCVTALATLDIAIAPIICAISHMASLSFFKPSISSLKSIPPKSIASINIWIPLVNTMTSAAKANITAMITATAAAAMMISGTNPSNALPNPFKPCNVPTIPLPAALPPPVPPVGILLVVEPNLPNTPRNVFKAPTAVIIGPANKAKPPPNATIAKVVDFTGPGILFKNFNKFSATGIKGDKASTTKLPNSVFKAAI